MIEGYSQQGGGEERYRQAFQRAAAVAEYVAETYRLDTKLVGIMPLDPPPPPTGKRMWDGVALVLAQGEEVMVETRCPKNHPLVERWR